MNEQETKLYLSFFTFDFVGSACSFVFFFHPSHNGQTTSDFEEFVKKRLDLRSEIKSKVFLAEF